MDERDVQLQYKKARLLPEETLVLKGRELTCMGVSQAMICGVFYFQAETQPEVIRHTFPTSLISNLQIKSRKCELHLPPLLLQMRRVCSGGGMAVAFLTNTTAHGWI